MKILKEGNPAKAVISCPHCKCEMEYTNKDIRESYGIEKYNSITAYPRNVKYVISCPCCGEQISVRRL